MRMSALLFYYIAEQMFGKDLIFILRFSIMKIRTDVLVRREG